MGLDPVRKDDWTIDDRYIAEGGVLPEQQAIPKGQPGILLGGTEEFSQETLFVPSNIPLIAPNKDGDDQIGTPVYDLNADDSINTTRQAPIQSSWRVIKKLGLCTGDKPHDSLSWQIGRTGVGDHPAYGLTVEQDGGIKGAVKKAPPKPAPKAAPILDPLHPRLLVIAPPKKLPRGPVPPYVLGFAGRFRAGPFDNSRYRIEHELGKDDCGAPIVPTGIAVEALFRDDNGNDAPLDFEEIQYKTASAYPFLTQTHIRHDETVLHKFPCGDVPGKWRLQSSVPYTIGDGDPLPEDGIPPPADVQKPKGGPEIGDDFVFDPVVDGIPSASNEEEIRQILVGDSAGLRREFFGNKTQALPSFPSTVRSGGGLVFRAFATAHAEADLATGSFQSLRQLNQFKKAPDVAGLMPVGKGTGQWSGFEYTATNKETGAYRAAGGLCLVPAKYANPDGMKRVLAGDFDPVVLDQTPETQASLFVPAKLASIDFARPTGGYVSGKGLSGNRTANGVRMHQTINGLEFQGLDSVGGEIASQQLIYYEGGDLTQQANNGVISCLNTSGGSAAVLKLGSSNGTIAAPTNSADADILGKVQFNAYDSFSQEVGSIRSVVEDIAASAFGLEFHTTDASVDKIAGSFNAAGNLDVYGDINIGRTGGTVGTGITETAHAGFVTATIQGTSGTLAYLSDITAAGNNFSYTEVLSSETLTISARQQMLLSGGLTLDGALVLDGELVFI